MNEEIVHAARAQRLWEQRGDQLKNLAAENLRDLARNDAAPREWRKAAVELLIDKKLNPAYLRLTELRDFVSEIQAERAAKLEVESVVESSIEAEIPHGDDPDVVEALIPPEETPGPFKASFTTKSF